MFPGTTSKVSESTLAASTTINPKTDLVRLTGTTTIATIIPNFGGGFSGIQYLTPVDDTVTVDTSGNVLVGQTMALNRVYTFIYSKIQAKWYIHAVA